MQLLGEEWFLRSGDFDHCGRVVLRLGLAVILGGILGYEREAEGKAAGLRTHILVCLGAALFMLVPLELGASLADLTRVAQGLAAGIGFLGAGAILKLSREHKIHGLTTAANLWVTTAVGMGAGLGLFWPVIIAVGIAVVVLVMLGWLEPWLPTRRRE
jgi:putative Mg2+ transporter-C (MgtC) family protein